MAEATVRPWGETTIVGRPVRPVDGYELVSGTAVYALDVILPDMLYGAILRCPHAHATVKKIDVGKARKMPGVRAVLTDADPEARVGWYAAPGPPGPGGRRMLSRLFDPHCRYEGEEVAAVAAESPQQAWDAVRAIQVEYQTQPFVTGTEEALKPGAPPVQEGGNRVGAPRETKRGDTDKGFAEADVVLEKTYRSSCEIHAPMEVHGSAAQWEGDRLTVWDTNQGPFGIQSDISSPLKMPLSKVRVISHYMGGGFGSKQEAGKYTIIAALLAQKTARPVRLFLTREETFLCVGNRPAHIMKLKDGVKKDGTLTAFQLTGLGEVGAYPSDTTVGYQIGDLYKCPNVLISESQAYINAGQNRQILDSYPALAQAAAAVGSPQLRNQGTLGGNLCQRPRCWYFRGDFHCLRKGGEACFAAAGQNQLHCIFGGYECFMVHPLDTAPALVALDAKVSVAGRRGARQMPLASFFVLPKESLVKENMLEPGDVVTEVLLDAPQSGIRGAYRKVRERGSFDFALAGAAIVLAMAEGKVRTARVVLSGVAPVPWRSAEAEQAIVGKPLDAATAGAAAAFKAAVPLGENGYKVPLVRGILEETLIALAA